MWDFLTLLHLSFCCACVKYIAKKMSRVMDVSAFIVSGSPKIGDGGRR